MIRSHTLVARPGRLHKLGLSVAIAMSLSTGSALAQSANDSEAIRQELQALRQQQTQISQLQQQNEAAIAALEARMGIETPAVAAAPSAPAPPSTPAVPAAPTPTDRLKVSGDFRLRSQYDRSDDDARDRTSGQVRARLGATYAVNERVSVGARLVTGDSDDPNSTDVQLSNWKDDLTISLDLAYAQLNFGDLKLYGGKFPQPFARTDLVWDGDVNPQGLGATYKHALGNGGALRTNGVFFVVDEQAGGVDSTMGGVQVGYDSPDLSGFKYDLSGAYYRYSLGSLAGADAGDWRTNRLNPDGTFLSDFELANLLVGATWQGSNEKWPLRVVGDYVKNLGAVDDQDTGYGIDVSLGRASKPGDWRFTYGYSQTDVDAVLSAFSHDNIGIATNYKLHALTVDYTPMPKTLISAIWYHYKPNDPAYAGSNAPNDWLDRVRLFFLVNF
ncbi:putative porin [Pseudoxanthomonas mexicana]|uniref:Putative porin n=1 Tax=Pseudoxanthomonas mexicana TaxID=128785 RepID=A0A7G9T9V9_PSEMX|nr:putative porin [Pseudoxanthomonas mexicana]QNN76884.1 putative porin [Pseudoxanthomonas mexicana]